VKINNYYKVSSLDEVYTLLKEKKNASIIAGGAWLKFSKKLIDAVDLSLLKINKVTEKEETFEIGCMTTLRGIETNEALRKYNDGIIPKCISEIMGLQIRNIATIGGTISGKYGFSDLITTLLALDTQLQFYKKDTISLEEFLKSKDHKKEILEKIIINKQIGKAKFIAIRKTSNDFAVLNVAVVKVNNKFRISVGARPLVAVLAKEAMEYINNQKVVNESIIMECAKIASNEIILGTNSKATKEYRKEICKVLIKRGLQEVNQ